MFLNEEQADAVLDIVSACVALKSAYDDAEKYRMDCYAEGKVPECEKVAEAACQPHAQKVTDSFCEAHQLGLSEGFLCELISNHLPEGLEFSVCIEHT